MVVTSIKSNRLCMDSEIPLKIDIEIIACYFYNSYRYVVVENTLIYRVATYLVM